MTSEIGELFNAGKAARKALRERFGVLCPRCKDKRPKAHPTIMLPGQQCKVDGYVDPRPRLTMRQRNECYLVAGVDMVELPSGKDRSSSSSQSNNCQQDEGRE